MTTLHVDSTTSSLSPSKLVPCDRKLVTGRRRGRVCGTDATHFDSARKENVCGVHAADVIGALPGTGTPWYADKQIGCDTPSHENRETRRTLNGVRMCMICSYDAEMASFRNSRGVA